MSKKKKPRDMQGLVLGTIIVVLLGLGIFGIYNQFREKVYSFTYANQPSIGSKNAPVKLIEFGDFKCPICKDFHDKVYPKLKKEYIDTGKVQMFFANYPVISNTMTASLMGETIYKQDPASFWKFYDVVYKNQGPEAKNWATPKFLKGLVKKHLPKIDLKKLDKAMKGKTHMAAIQKDVKELEKTGRKAVPTVFVNGVEVAHPTSYAEIKKAIEEALK